MVTIELTGENWVAGLTVKGKGKGFRAIDPRSEKELFGEFFEATQSDIDASVEGARAALDRFVGDFELRSRLLDQIATELEGIKEEILQRANEETALPLARLSGELVRTQGQLRMFAELLREGSWVDARIDRADPERKPVPKPDLRRMLLGLGPVAVFGASNFPLAFSVAGGDTASALAAGCPVIFKAHPAHPGTSELVGRAIVSAVIAVGAPLGVFSLLHGGPGVGKALVQHPGIEAVAFTGSLKAGRALFDLGAGRTKPIPVFAEMGSTNPIFALPVALDGDLTSLAEGYVNALTAGVGQFCTNPGLLLGIGPRFNSLLDAIAERLQGASPGTMLTPDIRDHYIGELTERKKSAGLSTVFSADHADGSVSPALQKTTAKHFLEDPELAEELFGPAAIGVECESVEEMIELATRLPGQLTATIHAAPGDRTQARELLSVLSSVAGRIIYNGFPTGVEVSSAMQHGGPYPASTDSRFTSVGTAAILRFVRPLSYQNIPDDLLPDALKRSNPLDVWRTVDGVLTREEG